MTRTRASLSRRLLIGAAVLIAAAILFAAVALSFVLHRFVQGQIDQRLDTQIVFLTSMLRADANRTLTLAGNADGPPFDQVERGWYWQISGPNNRLRSHSLDNADLPQPLHRPLRPGPPPPPRDAPDSSAWPDGVRPEPGDGPGPRGEPLHFRTLTVNIDATPATVTVSSPRTAVMRPLREAVLTLVVSLLILGVALIAAMLLQVRLGLRPLHRLRQSVSEIRAGRIDRLPAQQPQEIEPLVAELNALLVQNAANLERARRHVANLAHGLKTPLATLALSLPRDGERSREWRDLVEVMERRIRHHLGRARAAALNGPARACTPVKERINDVLTVLAKVHAEKDLAVDLAVLDGLNVACEQQDFDEMVGNLLENAFKWGRHRIAVTGQLEAAGEMVLTIADDGPGLADDQVMQALEPGRRLDETAPGFGFGLTIVRELVELYGGALVLRRRTGGGLEAVVRLPAA